MKIKKPLIGFIGQGFVGKNIADNFEKRKYQVVRYSLEPKYKKNKNLIKDCDFVFIAVPTPTTPKGFDSHIVRSALMLIGDGKTAVIKSTILPGTTDRFQKEFSNITVLFAPEFLSEATASYDASHPPISIIGVPEVSLEGQNQAKILLSIMADSPHKDIVTAQEAELFKYIHNTAGYVQVVWFNILYDMAEKLGCNWRHIEKTMEADPFISKHYSHPIHKSGRGAGGNCFIKDFSAFTKLIKKTLDIKSLKVARALESKNIALLSKSSKDLDLLSGVYGKKILNNKNKK